MATWYVATNGSDAAAGSQAAPFRTIGKAVTSSVAGDTVLIAGDPAGLATYSEEVKWSKALTFRAAPGPRPVLDGQGTLKRAFETFTAANCRWEGLEIRNYTERGIHRYGSQRGAATNDTIHNNHIHHIENNLVTGGTECSAIYAVYGNPTCTQNVIHHIRGKNESIACWFLYCNNHVFDRNTVMFVRKECVRDYLSMLGTFTNNILAYATTGWAGNESGAALVANNYIAYCMMGVNPKHSNDPFVPADATQYQSAVLYLWGYTSATAPAWCRIWHNTIHECSWGHFTIAVNINPDGVSGYTHQVDIRNNLCTGRGNAYIWDAPQARTADIVVDYNVFDTTAGQAPSHLYSVLYDINSGFKDTLAQVRTDLGWEVHGQQVAVTIPGRDSLALDPTTTLAGGASLPTQWGTQIGARGLSLPSGMSHTSMPTGMSAISSSTTAQSSRAYTVDKTVMTGLLTSTPANEWVVFDAGSSVTLNNLLGENLKHFLSYNPQDIRVETGTSPTGPWTVVREGKITDSGGTVWPFDWAPATSRYWRFTALTNFGHATWINLSELLFANVTIALTGDVGAPVDTAAPTVALTAPADGASVSGDVTISATAADNVAVDRVEFLVDGVVVGTDASSPYSIVWATSNLVAGSRVLTAKAYDKAGNVTTSASRTVTVTTSTPPAPDIPAMSDGYWGQLVEA